MYWIERDGIICDVEVLCYRWLIRQSRVRDRADDTHNRFDYKSPVHLIKIEIQLPTRLSIIVPGTAYST